MQGRLDANQHTRTERNTRSGALLLGLLHDDRGNRMSPSYAVKGGMRYRYYVSATLAQGRKADAGSVARVAAEDIERVVIDALGGRMPS